MPLSYPNPEGRFDELFAAPGRPRPTWSRLYSTIVEASAGEIREMRAAAEQQIKDSGVTYNVYADPKGQDRPWDLDVLPLMIDAQEWAQIEAGIAQRATVLNALLGDLYGPQVLLKEGLIPSRLVHGHTGFLRPAHGAKLPGGIHLHVYGADLCRSPDGKWWVMGDRTQAPRAVPGPARAAPGALLRHHAGFLPALRAQGRWPPAGGAAHAGAVERNLFRAHAALALSRLPAGAGR
jgi:uncharacterized circularly permuted ATP-grasp superfamily protein